MPEQTDIFPTGKGLRSRPWLLSYRTSATLIDGRPVNMLHDFYLPVLQLAVRYDRVAGYFRSSSLAAASQGFSAFVGRRGQMRLIVGADLEPADVRAILAGDRERLAARLNGELEHPHAWPREVQDGVSLLAWMVGRGYLEVRVAFRVHGETGEPLPFNAVDDGYVHEKWFLLEDEFGQRLYGSGTLNESRTALVLNAENIDVHCDWWGETERRRAEEAAAAFTDLWQGRVRHLPVLTLPEAVQRRLIQLAAGRERPLEVDGTGPDFKAIPPPSALERLQFAVLRDGPHLPGGRFVGMETAPVAPWPHQAMVVRRLVATWPYSYLLCDEVGLGKTIEAGLAFRSLYLAGLASRILIAAPASLTRQWQRQMASKLLLSFGLVRTTPEIAHEYIFPREEVRAAASIYDPGLVIISTGLLARRERAEGLKQAAPLAIALVDEAHAARRRNPAASFAAHPDYGHLYTTIRDYLRPQARSLWLATATPMQIDPVEACDLLALTNRTGAFQFDPSLIWQYYEILGKLVRGEEPETQEWAILRRAILTLRGQDPLLWQYIASCVIDGRIRVAVRQWLEYDRVPHGRDRELMGRLFFSAAPLSRVMLRHTRRLLEVYRTRGQLQQNLARRHILPMPTIKFTPLEQLVYEQLERYCNGLNKQIQGQGDHQTGQMMSFLLSFLRLRFASSTYALRETLRRRLARVEATLRNQQLPEIAAGEETPAVDILFLEEDEDDEVATTTLLKKRKKADLEWERLQLQALLAAMVDLSGPSSKMQVLLQCLNQRRERQSGRLRQTVIFTRFYDTLTDILDRLRQKDPAMRLGTYSGQGAVYFNPLQGKLLTVDREEVKERFLRGEIDVLICTDAAAEGLNLQTADLLVNFDLGWNPMKIEQRIGRIDRIGQQHEDIYVLNLCYAGSAEEVVYNRLLDRLAKANLVVGPQQVSLLPVEPEEFQQLAAGTLTPDELEARLRERLERQRRQTESMEIKPEELYEIYQRWEQSGTYQPAPVNLAAIWEALQGSRYLQDLGCTAATVAGRPVVTLPGLAGIPAGAILTVSRELYEEGLADAGSRVHFASYGDPVFDALLAHLGAFALPACVQRLAVPLPDIEGAEIVGYAVACHEPGGGREVRLVRSWQDLTGLELAEEKSLAPEEVALLQEELARLAAAEFQPYRTAAIIEQANIRAARAQEVLNFLAIYSLLEARAKEGMLFGTALREVESLFTDRERINVADVPAAILRPFAGELLFACQIPTIGDKFTLSIPRPLARTAIDAVNRLVDGMKVRRGDLRVATVLTRLKGEIKSREKLLRSS